MKFIGLIAILIIPFVHASCQAKTPSGSIKDNYTKIERMIPMRDGVKLFTAIYIPKDDAGKYPFLIQRTPYSCRPYGENSYPSTLGPGKMFTNQPYIFVYQDVRGRYMSEGNFEEMTPHIDKKKSKKDVDESSDAFDTIDWLLKNVSNNNGKAGIYGISYPGFYATASLPGAHPALKAVSPQAPIADEFEGDDANHRGAFFLMDNYDFLNDFDHPRDRPWKSYPSICTQVILDAYSYYLDMGSLKRANEICYDNQSKIWNEYLQHTTKDAYWQARDIRKHLNNIKPAVLVTGGWFDAEDLFGALNTYGTIEKKNAKNNSRIIMGPWTHGGWARSNMTSYAGINLGSNTSEYFQNMEFDFFNYYLRSVGKFNAKEATIFETGTNAWKQYTAWPPKEALPATWYLTSNKGLSFVKIKNNKGSDEYISDPAKPVPYMDTRGSGRNNAYMAADQTFASERSDVLTYTSPVLTNDVTITGPITADLHISTTGTDADFVVKVIDVLPEGEKDVNGKNVGGVQRLVRAEVLRGKFRNSFSKPEPFVPGKVTHVKFNLNDVSHSFKKGHKIMVQVQSSWFPLVDRNPQKFLNIPQANREDFQKATIKIFHDAKHPSTIKVLQIGG